MRRARFELGAILELARGDGGERRRVEPTAHEHAERGRPDAVAHAFLEHAAEPVDDLRRAARTVDWRSWQRPVAARLLATVTVQPYDVRWRHTANGAVDRRRG